MALPGFPYRGHYIRLDPQESRGKWEAQVVVEVHAKGETERIYYHDHLTSYATREEALAASREFGRRMVENFTVPAYGEGICQEPPSLPAAGS
ncbi:MAG: hypothetical protein ACYC9Y_11985 [Candidatus Methylomirabilia bacterium]